VHTQLKVLAALQTLAHRAKLDETSRIETEGRITRPIGTHQYSVTVTMLRGRLLMLILMWDANGKMQMEMEEERMLINWVGDGVVVILQSCVARQSRSI